MFLSNKYTTIYNKIISNASNRNIEDYTENHHILPRSMGGSDNKDNIVSLTAKEHYICHLLLTKMTDGVDRQKMLYAYMFMVLGESDNQSRYKKYNGRLYESLKRALALEKSKVFSGRGNPMFGKTHTKEAREKISNAAMGRKLPQEMIDILRKINKGNTYALGMKHSEEQKALWSAERRGSNNPFYGKTHSDETLEKMSNIKKGNTHNLGNKHTQSSKTKISESLKKYNEENDNPFYGKTHSDETKKTISAKIKEWHQQKTYKDRYIIHHPDGNTEIVGCLKHWASDNNVSYETLKDSYYNNRTISRGKLKGFLVKDFEEVVL